MPIAEAYRSGRELYGDNFTQEEIEKWFEEEEHGYFDLKQSRSGNEAE